LKLFSLKIELGCFENSNPDKELSGSAKLLKIKIIFPENGSITPKDNEKLISLFLESF
jgi:hypothetical protein